MIITPFGKKTAFLTIIYLLATASLVIFGLLPSLSGFISSQNDLKTKQTELKSLETNADRLDKIAKNSEDIDKVYQTVNTLWPDKEEVSNFIVQIEGLAASKNLVISSLSIAEKPIIQAGVKSNENSSAESKDSKSSAQRDTGILFSLDTTGSYSAVKEFVIGLEKLSRYTSANNIGISRSSNGEIAIKVTGFIYAK